LRRIAAVALGTALLLALAPGSPASAASGGDETPREPSAHSVVYREQAIIHADQARIWQLIVDLPGYARWNPWVIRADGGSTPGSEVAVDVVLGRHVMPARHVVLVNEAQSRFCWRDAGWNAIFVYGQRCRTLQPQADGSILFKQELLLDGIFSPAADFTIGQAMRDGMAAETAALKRHAEQ